MPWCPKCKSNQQVGVSMRVCGDLDAESSIFGYPMLESCAAELDDDAWCFECEYEAPLKEFQNETKNHS